MFEDNISDDYLICLLRDKNQDAIDLLYERYTKFIFGIIKSVQHRAGCYVDFNDLFQEAFLSFLVCIDRYDGDNGNFYFFTRKSIEKKLFSKFMSDKKQTKYLSLENEIYNDSEETIGDYISESNENVYFDNCLYETLIERIDSVDRGIVDLRLDGYSYQEIAVILNLSKQCVYRHVGKIKNIIKDIIEKID